MTVRAEGATWLSALTLLAIVWLVVLALIVTVFGPTPSLPWVGTLHTIGAGALLLLVLAATGLAVAMRRRAPQLWPPAAAALAVLIVTAAFGMFYSAGVLPTSLAPLQFALLGATVLLLGLLLGLLLARSRGTIATAGRGPPPS